MEINDAIFLKEINSKEDIEIIFYWRQNKQIYDNFLIQKKPLIWEDHLAFWSSYKNRYDWLIMLNDRRIGSVYFKKIDDATLDIGIYISDLTLWGRGIASIAVQKALIWAKGNNFKSVTATILRKNHRSIGLFIKNGFLYNNEYSDSNKFDTYELKL